MRADAALGGARPRRGCCELRAGAVDGVVVDQSRPGAVRHRAGRRVPGPARRERRRAPSAIGFEGYAIGGLSVGEPIDVMYEVVGAHRAAAAGRPAALPDGRRARPTTWSSAWRAASTCSTACCRPGTPGTASSSPAQGRINIKNARYAEDDGPLDPACGCYTCRHFSRAYLRHLFMAGEMTRGTLNTLHNLYFYLDTMRRIREAIAFGPFESFRQEFHQTFSRRAVDLMTTTVSPQSGSLLAMAAPPGQAVSPLAPAHSVRPRPRHLLLRDPAADEAAAEEGAGVPGRA